MKKPTKQDLYNIYLFYGSDWIIQHLVQFEIKTLKIKLGSYKLFDNDTIKKVSKQIRLAKKIWENRFEE